MKTNDHRALLVVLLGLFSICRLSERQRSSYDEQTTSSSYTVNAWYLACTVGSGTKMPSSSKRDGYRYSRMMVPGQGPMDGVHHHLHPSRALWEGQATPSPSATANNSNNNSVISSSASSRRPFASGGGRKGGGGRATDTFYSPFLQERSPAPSADNSSLGQHWSWLQQQPQEQQQAVESQRLVVSTQPTIAYGLAPPSKYEQQLAAEAAGGIDRPALRGQEYRRDKKRRGSAAAGRRSNDRTTRPTSSLMRSGSELDGQSQQSGLEKGATPTRRFFGIPLPFLPGPGQGHSEVAAGDVLGSYGGGVKVSSGLRQGGGGGGFMVAEDNRRLRVSLEGTQELGKGLGGHTVYIIQVGVVQVSLSCTTSLSGVSQDEVCEGWGWGRGCYCTRLLLARYASTAMSWCSGIVSGDWKDTCYVLRNPLWNIRGCFRLDLVLLPSFSVPFLALQPITQYQDHYQSSGYGGSSETIGL